MEVLYSAKSLFENKFYSKTLKQGSSLEQRQYKNDSIQSKSAPISKLELFLTEWSRSYIVFALENAKK